jgi:hypothetical protein
MDRRGCLRSTRQTTTPAIDGWIQSNPIGSNGTTNTMTKLQFMRRMHFPAEWQSWDMYPGELYQRQLESYQPGNERASEHFRNGAFHWWLKRDLSDALLIKLIFLTARDPDRLMARDVRGHILRRPALPTRIAEFLTLYETLETELDGNPAESRSG